MRRLFSAFLVLVWFSCLSSSEAAPPPQNAGQLIRAIGHGCLLKSSEVVCFDNTALHSRERAGGFRNATALSANKHSCVVDDDGLWCWDDGGQLPTPSGLKRVREVTTGPDRTCVIDDSGVNCWGRGQLANVPAGLRSPKNLAANDATNCVIDDRTVKCWGHEIPRIPTDLTDPTYLAMSNSEICVIDSGGVRCWDARLREDDLDSATTRFEIPQLDKPYAVSVAERFACALDKGGLTCWGQSPPALNKLPKNLKNPRLLSANCVVDDFGPHCWPAWPQESMLAVPPGEATNPRLWTKGKWPNGACMATDEGIQCSGSTHVAFHELKIAEPLHLIQTGRNLCAINDNSFKCAFSLEPLPVVTKPHHLFAYNGGACVVDGETPVCWPSMSRNPKFPSPAYLLGVQAIFSQVNDFYGDTVYAAVADRVIAWGEQSQVGQVPQLKNTQALTVDAQTICAIDTEGLKCWSTSKDPARFLEFYPLKNAISLDQDDDKLCVVDDDGVRCWDQFARPLPTPILRDVNRVTVDADRICAEMSRDTARSIQCWNPSKGVQTFDPTLPWYDEARESATPAAVKNASLK